MFKIALASLLLVTSAFAADKMTAPQLIGLSKSDPSALKEAMASTFDAKELTAGTAWTGHGSDFFFVTAAPTPPELMIDGAPGPKMKQVPGTGLWYSAAQIPQLGKLHSFYYSVNGAKFGGRTDVPAFGSLSYLQPGAPSGKLSD